LSDDYHPIEMHGSLSLVLSMIVTPMILQVLDLIALSSRILLKVVIGSSRQKVG
jgi:hypothetical protein